MFGGSGGGGGAKRPTVELLEGSQGECATSDIWRHSTAQLLNNNSNCLGLVNQSGVFLRKHIIWM